MAMLTGAMLRLMDVKTVGLCHSVQVCCETLLRQLNMPYDDSVQWKIAGINHQAWLLECTKDGVDLYPEIRRRAILRNQGKLEQPSLEDQLARARDAQGVLSPEREAQVREAYERYEKTGHHDDMVRLELMLSLIHI